MIDVLVVGSGGNGHTYFISFLNKNKIITNNVFDRDKMKHKSCPTKINSKKIKKCIFLYNDPLKSILSHYRRKWQDIQMHKLGNPYKLSKSDITPINKLLKITVDKGEDVFGIKHQFDNWINADVNFPILFLDFNNVLESKGVLNKFLEKNLDYSFFEKKSRISSIKNDIDPTIIKIYSHLYDYIKNNANIKNALLI